MKETVRRDAFDQFGSRILTEFADIKAEQVRSREVLEFHVRETFGRKKPGAINRSSSVTTR
jgi:hypothetical protein